MDFEQISRAAFLDELEKIGVSRERLRVVAPDRRGTRPISVDNFLKKEKDGTLYRETGSKNKVASYFDYAFGKQAGDWAGTPVAVEMGVLDPNAARKPRRRGDVPSQDDVNAIDRTDGRENATTVHGPGQTLTGGGT